MGSTLDPAHSAVTVSALHMMVTTVRGDLQIRDFDLEFDPDRIEESRVRVCLDAASIDTARRRATASLASRSISPWVSAVAEVDDEHLGA
jgi:polyisoprenoid-binding protein YceI